MQSVETRFRTIEAQYQQQFAKLKTEVAETKQRIDYVNNAYRGLKHKHDQLQMAYDNAIKDAEQLRTRLEATEKRKARAEQSQRRVATLTA